MGTLRLVDCAFSAALGDRGVEALVRAAPRLERVNLRGCKSVLAACYNQTPITLALRGQRRGGGGGGGDGGDGGGAEQGRGEGRAESGRSKARKGDNMFFFTSR